MPATELMARLRPDQLGGAKVFRAFGTYKRGDIIPPDALAAMPMANLRALMDQRFIVAWPLGEGPVPVAPVIRQGEPHIVQRPGTNRYDVILGEKLNVAPLSKADADRLAAVHRVPAVEVA